MPYTAGMKKPLLLFIGLMSWLPAQTLTLDHCVRRALDTSPDVKSRALQVREQHEDVALQKGDWLPQLSAWGEYDPQRTYVMPQNGQFHTIDDDGWAVGVSLRQKIYDFSKTSHAVDTAESRKTLVRLSYEEARALMRYEVRTAYAQMLVQKDALDVRKKDLDAKNALYAQAKALYEQGLKTRADMTRLQAATAQAAEALAAARAAFDKARFRLERYIGEAVPADTELETAVLYADAVVSEDVNATLQNSLALRIARQNTRTAHESYRTADAEHYGSIDALAEADHFDNLSRYDTVLVGIRYAVPLYSGGRISARAQQSRIKELIARENEASARRLVVEETRALLADLRQTERRIEARRAQELAALETRTLVEARYAQGLATYIEVLDAQAQWLDAGLGLLEAYYTRTERRYRLEYLNAK